MPQLLICMNMSPDTTSKKVSDRIAALPILQVPAV